MVEGGRKSRLAEACDDGPVLFMPVGVPDQGIEDQVPHKDFPSRKALRRVAWRLGMAESLLDSFHGVVLSGSIAHRFCQQFIARDEFLGCSPRCIVGGKHRATDDSEPRALRAALRGEFRARCRYSQSLSNLVRNTL